MPAMLASQKKGTAMLSVSRPRILALLVGGLTLAAATGQEAPREIRAERSSSRTVVHKISAVMEASVALRDQDRVGKVVDVVLSDGGCVEYLVVSGENHYVLVPWSVTKVDFAERVVRVDITREKWREVPTFSRARWPNLSDASFTAKVRTAFGVKEGANDRSTDRTTGRQPLDRGTDKANQPNRDNKTDTKAQDPKADTKTQDRKTDQPARDNKTDRTTQPNRDNKSDTKTQDRKTDQPSNDRKNDQPSTDRKADQPNRGNDTAPRTTPDRPGTDRTPARPQDSNKSGSKPSDPVPDTKRNEDKPKSNQP